MKIVKGYKGYNKENPLFEFDIYKPLDAYEDICIFVSLFRYGIYIQIG